MRDLKFQLLSALLMILTAAAAVCAFINFQQQSKFRLPDDGVTWVERQGAVQALHIVPQSQGDRAGLRPGDILLSINGAPVQTATDVTKVLVRLGAWSRPTYLVRRSGVEFEIKLFIGEVPRDYTALYAQYLVGAAWLAIGLFVFFRRGNAHKAVHFYVLCLASFVFSSFHYTGKLNNFDKVMYFGNVVAWLLAPTIFVHFCLSFPEPRRWLRRARAVALYLPAAALIAVFFGVASGTVRTSVPPVEMRWLLDRLSLAFLVFMYLLGGVILALAYRRASDPIVRQQLKWLRNGALCGITPFAVLYAVPYLLGAIPGEYMSLSVLSFLLIPLTWAYAIVRYRLMDVDIIFQQGYVYTLATISVLALFYGLIFSFGKFEDLGPAAAAVLILIAAFIFQPIRNWIQEQLDRSFFYKDRYDYRRTLVEFARELSSETDVDRMLSSAGERLIHTLSIQRIVFFLLDEQSGRFRVETIVGGSAPSRPALDLSFLTPESSRPYFFFEQTRHPLDVVSQTLPASVRETIAALDLTYYIPCSVRGRTIAYVGVSRTAKGDFLTSEDIELLETVSGYIGIAIENARLYHSLERKMEQYERLKEYSENIVESINVGIVAVDLEDRVESWNAQMESLTGILRQDAVGRTLADLLPAELAEKFAADREDSGIQHIYRFPLRLSAHSNIIELPVRQRGNGKDNAAPPPPARELILNIAIAPLVSRELKQIGRLIIFDDVTEREELERRLVQADKLSSVGLLAAGVAHEVNTPLAVISTYAQMLAKQISGDDQKSRLLEKIAKQTFRASEIVNSLLNFSRVSPTTFEEVDLNRIIQETLPLIEHHMEKAGIKLQLDLEEHLPSVKANVGKLQQVFLNLFLNARDAMESGGILTISSRSDGQAARIDITDTGHGIQPEDLHRIFDPFFTTKAGRKGTGLGLSVTYGIVREHGGTIEADSRPGEGTRFHLEFPLARKAVHA